LLRNTNSELTIRMPTMYDH